MMEFYDNYKDVMIYPVAYYNKKWTDFDMGFHRHPTYELMYIEDGECDISFSIAEKGAGKLEKTICFVKDMAVFIEREFYHKITVKNTAKILDIEFKKKIGENIFDLKSVIQSCKSLKKMIALKEPYIVYKNASELLPVIKKIQEEIKYSNFDFKEKEFIMNIYVCELLIRMGKVYEVNNSHNGIIYIDKCMQYIRDHYSEELTADDLVKYLQISKGYMHKIIKQETGKTLFELITELRVKRAMRLLKYTKLPIIDIAVECGFNNRQSFYYAFKKTTGVSADKFRKDGFVADTYSYGDDYRLLVENNDEGQDY